MAYTYNIDGSICVVARAKISAADVVAALDHDGLVEFVEGIVEEADDDMLKMRIAAFCT